MSTAVTGSIATDHLMRFPGRFADQLIADRLHTVSLSFLVDDLVVRRGGVAANIAYGMAQLGARPVLVGAVGPDFADYRSWLERAGVDCGHLLVSTDKHTARFVCTTDDDLNQIASFYPGAMNDAAGLDLATVAARTGGLRRVLVGAETPDVMLGHAAACRRLGVPFAADPSQQLATMSGGQIEEFVAGAAYLLTNEYEYSLLLSKTGMSDLDLMRHTGTVVTTLGERGVRIRTADGPALEIAAAATTDPRDPTGVGDAFRAGFFSGLDWGLAPAAAAQLGCQVATLVLETVGSQEYRITPDVVLARLAESYGAPAAALVDAAWPRRAVPAPT